MRVKVSYLVPFVLALLLAACARPALTGFSKPIPDADIEQIFVATQRPLGQLGPSFGSQRSATMNYLKYDISIPPEHELGKIERTSGIADPARYFAPVGFEVYDGPGSFNADLRRHRTGDGGLVLFVHGYNNTFEDAAFRLAQIRHDFELEEPGLLFSWPSAGDPRGYVYDRDSVIFARDGFEQVLRGLHASGQRKILLIAHSMGGYLVMETLRQIAIKGDRRLFNALEGVILMSPDIDPDIFRQQARVIGELPQPFIIMTSQRDQILNLSSLLTGRKPRLGRIEGPEAVAGLNVSVVDFSGFDDAGFGGHMAPVSSAKAIQLMRGLDRQLSAGRTALGEFVLLGMDQPTGLLLQ